jgi:hypothetical protein
MGFETISPYEAEDNSAYRQGNFEAPERLGGPLKQNHFLTTKIGMEEATPILDRLKVRHKLSLYMAEASLNTEAVVPAEYRLEIMDPVKPDKPASEEYVQYVFNALKEAGVPVQKAARNENDETVLEILDDSGPFDVDDSAG